MEIIWYSPSGVRNISCVHPREAGFAVRNFSSVLETGSGRVLRGGAAGPPSPHRVQRLASSPCQGDTAPPWTDPEPQHCVWLFVWFAISGVFSSRRKQGNDTTMACLKSRSVVCPAVCYWWTAVVVVVITLVHLANVVVSDEQVPGSGYVEVPCCTHHFRHQKGN